MPTPVYTQQNLFDIVDGNAHGKSSQVVSRQNIVNRAVRFVYGDMDLRSAKRHAQLSPNLFSDAFDYAVPSDLKGKKIIDVKKQVDRPISDDFILVDETDFDQNKNSGRALVAFSDNSFSRILKISGSQGFHSADIHTCDSLTANGTWAVVAGTDASNLTLDSNNYITGSGSLNFDLAAGAATAAIELTGATQVDLSDWDEQGAFFVWVYIPDYSDAEGDTVTNFILRWGNDSSNYWSRTVTVNNEGQTFHDGWNLLRFDWDGSATETGTVDPNTIDYIRLTITKSTSLAADTDWRVDDIVFRVGEIYNLVYYSKYGWTNSGGTYIENSSATTDLVCADTDELELISIKIAEYTAQELRDYDDVKIFRSDYLTAKKNYAYESEAMTEIGTYL